MKSSNRLSAVLLGLGLLLSLACTITLPLPDLLTPSPVVPGESGTTPDMTAGVTSVTPPETPMVVCTPPACLDGEVFACPGECPGGCGTVCKNPYRGFMALQDHHIVNFDFAGNPLGFDVDGGDLSWLSPPDFTVLDGTVYYYRFTGTSQIFRADSSGLSSLAFISSENPMSVAVSPDGSRIAWAYQFFETDKVGGEVWVADINGANAQRIAFLDPATNPNYPILQVERWLPDGSLLYSEEPTGIGGYILFWGFSSLYKYNDNEGTIRELVPYGDHFICINQYYQAVDGSDMILESCGRDMSIVNLSQGTSVTLPVVDEQVQLGSAKVSPSGKYIAYAVQSANYDDEKGKVVIAPVDGSAAPTIIMSNVGVIYGVLTWVNEETLLVQESPTSNDPIKIISVRRDGSAMQVIVTNAKFLAKQPEGVIDFFQIGE